ncbi:MAG: MerR family transcriptional regulator, partial [Synergistaceae bacterium]|nr:MerR family transcriptional regulator [Synergistaceae bacterium]
MPQSIESRIKNEGLLSIGELARFVRVSRTSLLYYENTGLLSSAERGDNNFRYYSYRQIALTGLIITLRELDVSLKEITDIVQFRTPEGMMDFLSQQSASIERNIERLLKAKKLLLTLKGAIEDGIAADEGEIKLHHADEESILLGSQVDYSDGKSLEEAALEFYEYCYSMNEPLILNYPVWGIFSEERLKRQDWVGPDRFCLRMPDAPDRKPEGLYLTGYSRGSYGQNDDLYVRLMEYIAEHNLEICGPAYEMYLIDEISTRDPYDWMAQVSIRVKRSKRAERSTDERSDTKSAAAKRS